MTMTAEIMTTHPITCGEHESMNVAAQRMWEHDIGALPVTNAVGRTVGVITDRDIAMAAYTQGKPLHQMTVSSAMSKALFAVRPTEPLLVAETIMQRHQVRRVPVIDDAERPVGVLTLNDLARCAASGGKASVSLEELSQTLRAMCEPRTPASAGMAAE
jgi:CBS domain-containing protein